MAGSRTSAIPMLFVISQQIPLRELLLKLLKTVV